MHKDSVREIGVLLASLIFTISNASLVSIPSVNATELLNASVIEGEERNSTGTQGQKVQSNVAGNQTTNVTIIQAQPKNPQILEFQGGNTGGGDEGKPCQQIKIGKSTGGITPGADKLVGGSQVNDCLYGRGGNDWLIGDGGNDQLFGEDGNDKLEGGDGSDLADGGDGNDDVLGGAQNDILYGGTGNDGVYGFEGDDKLSGGPGNDVLVDVHGGADQFICGAGIDKIYGYKQSEGDTKDDCEQILEVIPPN